MFRSNACEKLGEKLSNEEFFRSVPSRLPSRMEPFNNPTYHHYRSAGTLFFNTQENDLINYQKARQRANSHSGSVPNINEYSQNSLKNSRTENLQRRRSMSSHDIIDYSPPSRSTNNGSTNRSHIYNTIGNFPNHHQPFPKLIQVSKNDFVGSTLSLKFLEFLQIFYSLR